MNPAVRTSADVFTVAPFKRLRSVMLLAVPLWWLNPAENWNLFHVPLTPSVQVRRSTLLKIVSASPTGERFEPIPPWMRKSRSCRGRTCPPTPTFTRPFDADVKAGNGCGMTLGGMLGPALPYTSVEALVEISE